MKISIKRKSVIFLILLCCVALAVFCILSVPPGSETRPVSGGDALIRRFKNASTDFTTVTRISVGAEDGKNGAVLIVNREDLEPGETEVRFRAGSRVEISSVKPDAKTEIAGNGVYSGVIFNVPVVVEAESEVSFGVDVEFNSSVTVEGTMYLGGMTLNRGEFTVANEYNEFAEIQRRGVIVGGSFNNDAYPGGALTVKKGASFSIKGSGTYYADGKTISDCSGGALFLKADGIGSLAVENDGVIDNSGSVIYDSAAAKPDIGGVVVSADFVNSYSSALGGGTFVFYSGSSLDEENEITFDNEIAFNGNAVWLSFGQTVLRAAGGNARITVSGNNRFVILGGAEANGTVYTQGKNRLIFDGGAKWTEASGHALCFNVSDDLAEESAFVNNGVYSRYALVTVGGKSADYNSSLNIYGGVKITNHETRAGQNIGGGVGVLKKSANLNNSPSVNVYGGEISYNAVTQSANNGTGAGIYAKYSVVKIYGGSVTRNAVANYDKQDSADGAGLALDGSRLSMYGGEISYNRGSRAGTDPGADGGGIIARVEEGVQSSLELHGGRISGNYTGGSGGGIMLWCSTLTMTGGEISGNRASYGGGVSSVSDGSAEAAVTISGGRISGNFAVVNERIAGGDAKSSGYGGGICSGSNQYSSAASITVTGGEISGNRAVFGGGAAVYTSDSASSNTLTMTGGVITGNVAYDNNDFGDGNVNHDHGDGVYVYSKDSVYKNGNSILRLSGSASIDSSNNVSFSFNTPEGLPAALKTVNVYDELYEKTGVIFSRYERRSEMQYDGIVYIAADSSYYGMIEDGLLSADNYAKLLESATNAQPYVDERGNEADAGNASDTFEAVDRYITVAPVEVTGPLTGDGLAALIKLENEAGWKDTDIIKYSGGAEPNVNKFLLDSAVNSFTEVAGALRISDSASNPVARIEGKGTYGSVSDAVNAAENGDTVLIMQTSTLVSTVTVKGKSITVTADSDDDYTLGVATDFSYGSVSNPALFMVESGASLTLEGGAGRLAVDGNISSSRGLALVSVRNGGVFTLRDGATLRNNSSTDLGGAVYVGSNAVVNIEGGSITGTRGAGGAVSVASGGTVNYSGGEISGNYDLDGNAYGIHLSSSTAVLNLNGPINLKDGIYTEGEIKIGAGFPMVGTDTVFGVTFPAGSDAGKSIVTIPLEFVSAYNAAGYADAGTSAASYVLSRFAVANMASDFRIVVRDAATDTANALIVSKSVTYVFYFDYKSGFADNETFGAELGYGDFHETIWQAVKTYNPAFADGGKVKLRGNAVRVSVQYGESFNLIAFSSDYARVTGKTLINWQVGGAAGELPYNGSLEFRNSSAEITVRSVWVDNTYVVSFDRNASASASVGGSMEQAEFTYGSEESLRLNAFTQTGWAFVGWGTSPAGGNIINDGSAFGEISSSLISESDAPDSYRTDENGRIVAAVYNRTVYAQWRSIFDGGYGSAASPFVISDAADLYVLEATVNGTGTDGGFVTVAAEDGSKHIYYSGNDESGAAVYSANPYEGFYFRLTGDVSGFTGTIGRISTDLSQSSAHPDQDHPVYVQEWYITEAIYGKEMSAIVTGGDGAAPGTPFKGNFDGGNHTVDLNINSELAGAGLFGYTDHAVISDLRLTGSVYGYSHVGALTGYAFGGSVSGVYSAAAVTSPGHDVGGVIGTFYERASDYARSSVSRVFFAGEVKYSSAGVDLTDEADVNLEWNELGMVSDAIGVRFGGIVGSGISLRLSSAFNTGSVTARYGAGGLVGTLRSMDVSRTDDSVITESFNAGRVTSTAGLYTELNYQTAEGGTATIPFITASTGGAVGRLVGASSIHRVFNSGEVTARFVGEVTGSGNSVKISHALGGAPEAGSQDSKFYLGARGVGGVVGFVSYDFELQEGGGEAISYVYNTGGVSAWSAVGGIVGYLAHSGVQYAFNGGNITATGTHYDETLQKRVYGGYDGKVNYLGAIVGRGVTASLGDTVYFNTDSVYTGYTDNTVQSIGDSAYDATMSVVNSSNALGLTGNRMRVPVTGSKPVGFTTGFYPSGWSYLAYEDDADERYYYPQLSAFTLSGTINIGGAECDIAALSKSSVQLKKTVDGGSEPIEPTNIFRITFVLNGGSFVFDESLADGDNNYFTADGKSYAPAGADSYYYESEFSEERLELPVPPVRTGYVFGGWFTDNGTFTGEMNFDSVPGSDVTVYAKWSCVTYDIIYEGVTGPGGTMTGSYPTSFTIESGGREMILATAANTILRGFRFDRWQYQSYDVRGFSINLDDPDNPKLNLHNLSGDPATSIPFANLANGLALSAVWIPEEYSIEYYDEDGVTFLGSDTYTTEAMAPLLQTWEKTGFRFVGWQLADFESGDPVNASMYEIGRSYTVVQQGSVGTFRFKAVYEPIPYTLYFNAGEGGVIDNAAELGLTLDTNGLYSITLNYGDTLFKDGLNEGLRALVARTTQEGRSFDGWFYNVNFADNTRVNLDGSSDNGTPFSMPARDYTLYAKYKTDSYTVTLDLSSGFNAESETGGRSFKVQSGLVQVYFGGRFAETGEGIWEISDVSHGTDLTADLNFFVNECLIVTSGDGYHFDAWSQEGGNSAIYRVTSDMRLTAVYSVDKITVNFVGYDNNTLKSYNIDMGTRLKEELRAEISALLKADQSAAVGYDFLRWEYADGTEYRNDGTDAVFARSVTIYAVYSPRVLTVTFYVVKPDGSMKVVDEVGEGWTTVYRYDTRFGSFPELDALTANFDKSDYLGFEIDSWYADSRLTERVTTQTVARGENFSVSLYAKLGYKQYSVTFLAGGGSFQLNSGQSASGFYDHGGTVTPFPALNARTGYEFTGWSMQTASGASDEEIRLLPEDNGDYSKAFMRMVASKGITGPVTVIAGWKVQSFEVWYSAGEGEFTVSETSEGAFYADTDKTPASDKAKFFVVTVSYGQTPAHSMRPARLGYTFNYWTHSSGINAVISAEQYGNGSPIMPQFTLDVYTITYIVNGGNPVTALPSYSYGDDTALPVPIKSGYEFGGWYKRADCSGEALTSVSGEAGNLVLYAKWIAPVYELILEITVPVAADSVKEYVEGRLTAEFGGDADVSFTVSSAENLLTAVISAPYGRDVSVLNGILPNNISGWVPGGWQYNGRNYYFTTVEGSALYTAGYTEASDGSYTVEYYFTADKLYTSLFNVVDGAPILEISREGYTFDGWWTAPDGEDGSRYTDIIPAEGDDPVVRVYARWTVNRYNVVLEYNSGTVSLDGTMTDGKAAFGAELSYGAEDSLLPTLTRTGYSFDGWFTDVGLQMRADYMPARDITLYAGWTPVTYQINFMYGDTDGTQADYVPADTFEFTAAFGSALSIPDAGKNYPYYSYEWEVWLDGKSMPFGADTMPALDEDFSGFTQISEDGTVMFVNVYAVYSARAYSTVMYDGQGGKLGDFSVNVLSAADDFMQPAAEDIPVGYGYGGWDIMTDGKLYSVGCISYKVLFEDGVYLLSMINGEGVVYNVDITRIGEFVFVLGTEADEYEISFEPGEGGTTDVKSKFVTYDVPYGPLPLPVRPGYTFVGWSQDKTGGEYVYEDSIVKITQDTLLYAVWSPNTYRVMFVGGGADGGSVDAVTLTYDITAELPANGFTRSGYAFAGWAKSENGKKVYDDRAEVINLTAENNGTVLLYACWQAETYSVTLNTGENTEKITVTYKETYGKLPVPERKGYTFEGWFTATDGGSMVTEGTTVSDTQDHELYARWKLNEYGITYVLNGGSDGENPASYTVEDEKIILKSATKTGYKFLGWYEEENGTKKITEIDTAIASDITLYARWEAETYTVTLNGNGGKFGQEAVKEIIVTFGAAHGSQLSDENAPEKTGYIFTGWYLSAISENDLVDSDSLVTTAGRYTLYAHWQAVEYDVVFISGGEEIGRQTLTYDKAERLNLFSAELEGYSFAGWRDEAGAMYSVNAEVINLSDGKDVALTAVFKAVISLTGTGLGTAEIIFCSDDGEAVLPEPAVRTGYTFVGWKAAGEEAPLSAGKIPVSKLEKLLSAGKIELAAEWREHVYTVRFDANGGIGSMPDQVFAYSETKKLSAMIGLEFSGYGFLGWATEAGGSVVYDDGAMIDAPLTAEDGKTITLYAVWQAGGYSVVFDGNGADGGDTDEQNFVMGESQPLRVNAFTRTGYSFLGWSEDSKASSAEYANGAGFIRTSAVPGGKVILYAVWKANEYTVYFNGNGGTESAPGQPATFGSEFKAAASAQRTGYVFGGWWTEREGGRQLYIYDIASDITLYAHWIAERYIVSFETGCDIEDPKPIEVVYGKKYGSLPSVTRPGYIFNGWRTAQSGGVLILEDTVASGLYLPEMTENAGTLYASWTAADYSVSFDSLGGNYVGDITVTYKETYGKLPVPERKGYTFEGWFTATDGGSMVTEGTMVSDTQDHELYARWKLNEYGITYVLNGGSDGENPASYTVEDEKIILKSATKTGYKFLGWYEEENGTKKITEIDTAIASDITLYARWEAETYIVTFIANGGSDVGAQTVVFGGLAAFAKTERENYTFVGWYVDENMSEEYDFAQPVDGNRTLYAKWRLTAITTVSQNGIRISVSSDEGFDDGLRIIFEEAGSEQTEQAAGALAENVTVGRLYNIRLIDASGSDVVFQGPLSVRISLDGMGAAAGRYGVFYIPDDYNADGAKEITSTVVNGEILFYAEHFSFYAIVDILPVSAFAWWWILVAVGVCAAIAVVIALIIRSRRTYELSYVNGGIMTQKKLESALVELPSPESDDRIFEGWYYDDKFTDRAFITAMPKQNVILFAKWRAMTEEEKRAKAESTVRAEIVST